MHKCVSRSGALPNFLVIGAAKAGTTALYRYLSEHPQVSMSPTKEPHFFAPGAGPSHRRVTDRTVYEGLFSANASARGEASTSYSMFPRWSGVPARIRALVPEAQFIYLVRDPVQRLQSLYSQTEVPGRSAADFERWLGDLHDPMNWRVASSRYMTQIREYMKEFPAERLLVVAHDDLWHDRRGTLREVFGFLGVDADFWDDAFQATHNKSELQRRLSVRGARLYASKPFGVAAHALPRPARAVARRGSDAVLKRTTGPPEVGDSVREQLAQLLGREIEQLRSFTGKSFARWSM